MTRRLRFPAGLLGPALAAALVAAWAMPALGQRGPTPSLAAGNGTFYVGTYKGSIEVIDEASGKVTAEIPVSVGIPGSTVLSHDRTRFYVTDTTFEKVEILDRVKRTSIDTFTLSEPGVTTRIWGLTPDPRDRFLILVIKKYTLKADRWEIGPPTLVQYDLASKSITRTIPWPKNEEREGAGVMFSPDGKLMYLFGEDILIYETDTFTEVDRWELSRPLEPGTGRITIGGLDPFSDEPGFFTGLFTMQDPVQNRRIMGIGRIELGAKKFEFHPIGPARGMQFAVAPGRTRGYALYSAGIGEHEYWTIDLETHRVVSRLQFPGRPRMGLQVSTSGNLVYIHRAGNTIDVHEAATFRHLRTITLDGDMTSFLLLPPSPAPGGR